MTHASDCMCPGCQYLRWVNDGSNPSTLPKGLEHAPVLHALRLRLEAPAAYINQRAREPSEN